jgi:hypothetical protein
VFVLEILEVLSSLLSLDESGDRFDLANVRFLPFQKLLYLCY